MSATFQVKLEQFEGPLDLLFNLIEEEKLDITTISLAKITEDYLNYMKFFQEIDPFNLANFLVIAARLILIKSKALLPFLKLTQEEEAEIKDLENKLEVYRKYKKTAKFLEELLKKNSISFSREFLIGEKEKFLPPEKISVNDLRLTLERLLEEQPKPQILEEGKIKEIISLQNKIKEIQNRLSESLEKKFSEFINEKQTKIEIIVSFLAVLELVKQRLIEFEQRDLFGEIKLFKL